METPRYMSDDLTVKERLRLNSIAQREANSHTEMVKHYQNRVSILKGEGRIHEAEQVTQELLDYQRDAHEEAEQANGPTKKPSTHHALNLTIVVTAQQYYALDKAAAAWSYNSPEEYIETQLQRILKTHF